MQKLRGSGFGIRQRAVADGRIGKNMKNNYTLPLHEDLSIYAPPYFPEKFSREEVRILNPFFSNVTSSIYVVHGLPSEVIAALSSRYSRSKDSLRRLFLREYVEPIAYPERQIGWDGLSSKAQKNAQEISLKFRGWIDYLSKHGGIDSVVNAQRAQDFFGKWLAGYGDDSIAELGGAHVCVEYVSNIAANIIEAQRIGVSPLEKSSRYVDFSDTWADGSFRYVTPGELLGTPQEAHYHEAIDTLFGTYAQISQPYMEYMMEVYPQGIDEDEGAFRRSRGAKRFDDTRDLLPFATQTNIGLHGNGRAFENMIHRLIAHPSGEVRWVGQQMCAELDKVVPSFVKRPQTERGAEVQEYRRALARSRHEVARRALAGLTESSKVVADIVAHADLVAYDADGEKRVLAALLFAGDTKHSVDEIQVVVDALSESERAGYLREVLDARFMGDKDARREAVRFRKPPREWEHATYTYSVWSRAGDYRDLHRHRMMTHGRQAFTMRWGCAMEPDVASSPFGKQFEDAYASVRVAWDAITQSHGPDIAEYAVPFGAIQNYSMHMTARAVYWICELRTGPQGRPEYRMLSQQIADHASRVHPALFSGIRIDRDSYSLARRESEIKASKVGKSG